jgi:asparagine synthase (glutamine-hydrolysing)
MCGIAGVFFFDNYDNSYHKKVETAISSLKHRGPDAFGVRTYKKAILGHTRLSIIDLSDNANQPLEDENYSIVFNGEIYNYKTLKKELEKQGYKFSTQSDTEVLIKLYDALGKKMLEKLNGDFAFAIYDKKRESIFIARDRFGIKPLYFYNEGNFFAFASELKALSIIAGTPQIDMYSLKTLLEYTYIPAPFTIFERYRKLPAGAYLYINGNKLEINTYYELENLYTKEKINQPDEIKIRLKNLLEDSVRSRLVADVEVGTFLSGGLDSSIISAIAAKQKENLYSFNIGFPEHPYYDETPYALETAKHIGSHHTVFELTDKKLSDVIFEFLDNTSELFADSSALAFYYLSKQTSKHLKVILSGDGADEVFGGYNKHRAFLMANSQKASIARLISILLPSDGGRNNKITDTIRKVKKLASIHSLNPVEKYKLLTCFSCDTFEDNMLSTTLNHKIYELRLREMFLPIIEHSNEEGLLLNDIALVLQNDMLYKADYYSMLNSLEVRVPFLDHNVVEYASQIPAKLKFSKKETKIILKETFASMLPKSIVSKSKHGFEIPVALFIKNNFSAFEDLFRDDFIKTQQIFNLEEVLRLKSFILSGNPTRYQPLIWSYIVFQWWWKKNFL